MNEMQRQAVDRVGETGEALLRTTPPAATPAAPSDEDMVNAAYCLHKYRQGTDSGIAFNRGARWMRSALSHPAPVAAPAPASEAVSDEKLTVWFGSMPESNGKENWTAILYRQSESLLGGIEDGFTLARSEYHDRVRYDADMVRHLLGELPERPDILSYDGDMKSSAGDSADAPVQQAPTEQELFDIIRGTGFVTRGQAWDLVELVRAALKGEQPVEPSGSER